MKTLKLQRVTRYFGYILLVSLLFSACSSPFENPADRFENLTPPIILVAKSKEGAITVCDSKKKCITLGQEWYIAQTISNSYEKEDTLYFLDGNGN